MIGSWQCFPLGPGLSLFLHPFIFLSPRLPIFRALSPGLDTLSLCSPSPPSAPPPPPPLCLGPVWVINYSWACSEGPGLLIPAHTGLALIQPVVQLNWKPSYTSYRHTPTHTNPARTQTDARTCASRHTIYCIVALMHTCARLYSNTPVHRCNYTTHTHTHAIPPCIHALKCYRINVCLSISCTMCV